MKSQQEVHSILVDLVGPDVKVYHAVPSNMTIQYPCVLYVMDDLFVNSADNKPYMRNKRYLVTAIEKDPTIPIGNALSNLPLATFSRHYRADNLSHTAYSIYF